ncbi:lipase [Prochlorococcus marinus str. MU1404]|uniref:esterase/lipase family protein n=1 Tax=Prochlorococcus marinus TaxID=1219 RepID=UPI001ADB2DCC|nr:alpha/beta fold hydrolase [Prochlorococcus marinus]MBO8229795.1 alpha/beta fold hydrolase [Prochlorococcus marinus XMU1404]MBW3072873.1 lipase [Prochlorococcus marinus str. MU1404]MCR8545869.1 alpha/beta fold hydrolase [Prochlorococcus marinus CUG1432]
MEKRNPIILIHGLWNTSSIFSSITSKLDEIGIEYFAPNLNHSYGMTSIIDLTNIVNELILEKYGLEKKIDILGFSMGGIIGRYWLQKFNGYKRTRRFISIGAPHKGTLIAQLVPKFPFRGISEMKINSYFLRELAKNEFLLNDIECINFFTYWDLMVFPGWWTNLNLGKQISLKVYKHRNLVRNKSVVEKIINEIII